jgi:hypothetical protein
MAFHAGGIHPKMMVYFRRTAQAKKEEYAGNHPMP